MQLYIMQRLPIVQGTAVLKTKTQTLMFTQFRPKCLLKKEEILLCQT